ncbi:hypothetical protein NP493_986g00031 [Ridgeia piscesae]|uniref:Uncharacterized protein n=1 Tax=Ridgeia piscesae TaxID=27915 RepID=A0AAD9NJ41_RIDPI|nr:hypothetical protein NP493_986g00031 [Ridgeia piscesae]
MMLLRLTDCVLQMSLPPNVTTCELSKPAPVTVTAIPPPIPPEVGEMDVRAAVYAKSIDTPSSTLAAPLPMTDTQTVRGPAGPIPAVHLISVSEALDTSHVMLPIFTTLFSFVVPSKPVPVTVTSITSGTWWEHPETDNAQFVLGLLKDRHQNCIISSKTIPTDRCIFWEFN